MAYFSALSRLIRPIQAVSYPDTLAPMHALLKALAAPQKQLNCVVIGGSVGKGTTATYLAQLLWVGGARVGCYRGPHLHSWRERFAINDSWITESEFAALAEKVLLASGENGFGNSTFELNTALVFSWFANSQVDWAVLETGIGGRWDAVNAAEHELAILTPIEREHTNLLGNRLEEIARHKAGLIPHFGRAISAPQTPEVAEILRAEAESKGAQLTFLDIRSREPFALAEYLAFEAFRNLCPEETVPGISLIAPPGRYERHEEAGRTWLLDGGHTARAGQRLAKILKQETSRPKRKLIVLAMLRDKDVRAFVSRLDVKRNEIWLTSVPGNRALSAEELRARAGFQHAALSLIPEPATAIRHAQQSDHEFVVVTGSLRLVAIAREQVGIVSDALREEAQRTRALLAGEWKA